MKQKKESVYDKAHELYKDFKSDKDKSPILSPMRMCAKVEHQYGVDLWFCDKTLDELKQWCRDKWKELSGPTLAQIKQDGKIVWEHWVIKKETPQEFQKRKQKDKWQWVKRK